MTSKEALEILKKYKEESEEDYYVNRARALDMAIKALEQESSENWYDVPSDEMTLEQARRAVKELRKKLAERLEQGSCEDCISRETARRIVDSGRTRQQMIDMILATPPVTPTQRWIPVSERLPEVGKKILVTSYGRVCYAVMISTDGHDGYPIFRLQDSLKERTVCETIAHSDMTSSRIIAWMPLPEPYKAESEVR